MKHKRLTDPAPGKTHSTKQAEKDKKLFDNLVKFFPKKAIERHVQQRLEEDMPKIKLYIVDLETKMLMGAFARLWLNILLEAKENHEGLLRLNNRLLPNDLSLNNPLLEQYIHSTSADFALQRGQAMALLIVFTTNIMEEVKTREVKLPKNLVIKKDAGGFYVQKQ